MRASERISPITAAVVAVAERVLQKGYGLSLIGRLQKICSMPKSAEVGQAQNRALFAPHPAFAAGAPRANLVLQQR